MTVRIPFYVVTELCLDYDDEYYSVEEGGFPVAIYLDEKKAIQHAEALQVRWEGNVENPEDFYDYTYDQELPNIFHVHKASLVLDSVEDYEQVLKALMDSMPNHHWRVELLDKLFCNSN